MTDDAQRWLHGLAGLLGVDYLFQEVAGYHVGGDPGEIRIMRLAFRGVDAVGDRMDFGRYGSHFGEHLGDEIVGEVLMHLRALVDGEPSGDRQAAWDWIWQVERGEVDVDRSVLRGVLFTTFALVIDDPPPALRQVVAADGTLTRLRDALHERYSTPDPDAPVTRTARALAARWAEVVATYEPPP